MLESRTISTSFFAASVSPNVQLDSRSADCELAKKLLHSYFSSSLIRVGNYNISILQ